MDMQFWQLATSMQAFSSLLMAVFFVALSPSSKSRALRLWSLAWVANLAGLALVSGFWIMSPRSEFLTFVEFAGYVFFKSSFVVLLLTGTIALVDDRHVRWLPLWLGLAAVLGIATGIPSVTSFYYASTAQNTVIAVGLLGCATYLLRRPLPRGRWLAAAMACRALLALAELTGNLAVWQHWPIATTWHLARLIPDSSSLDAAAEWTIALASLLVFYELTQYHLTRTNLQLQQAQRSLQDLANHDQLTGLLNRRALPAILEQAGMGGASVVFFDIDHFKQINDNHGHDVGDACLKRFAAVLKECFRGTDRIVRYAGDEFIVFAPSLQVDALRARVEAVRRLLEEHSVGLPAMRFSHGVVDIAPGGDPETALRNADQAMYANKARRRQNAGANNVTPLRPLG